MTILRGFHGPIKLINRVKHHYLFFKRIPVSQLDKVDLTPRVHRDATRRKILAAPTSSDRLRAVICTTPNAQTTFDIGIPSIKTGHQFRNIKRKINKIESSSLSSIVEGIVKFDGKAECFDDGKKQVHINISKGKGYG